MEIVTGTETLAAGESREDGPTLMLHNNSDNIISDATLLNGGGPSGSSRADPLYPPGFQNCPLVGGGGITSTAEMLAGLAGLTSQESSLSSFLNSHTNVISENSWKNILLGAQDLQDNDNRFRRNNQELSPSPFLREGVRADTADRNNNHLRSYSNNLFPPSAFDNIPPIEPLEINRLGWDMGENFCLPGTKQFAEEMTNHFFGSSQSESRHAIFGNSALDNELTFLDTSGESSDMLNSSKGSNSFNNQGHDSGLWDSPKRNGGNKMNEPNPTSAASRLTSRECIQLIQTLGNSLAECNDTDGPQAAQILALMQVIQGQLMTEIHSPMSSSLSPTTPRYASSLPDSPVDRAAKFHREIAVTADAAFTWSGQLPPRVHRNPTYSCKIFLGGVPFDITENALMHAFKMFGNVKVEWPGKEAVPSQPKGYLYVIFEHEKQVKLLLQHCFLDYSKNSSGDWYFKLTSKRFREKDVQVIPWAQSDSNYVKCQAAKIDAKKTIFVGALHGMLNAEGLATIMNDLFGGVVYAGIDTDRHKYPIGSGRVTFNNMKSYMKAVSAAFVEIKTKFRKKVQVDPYLEDATCSICQLQQGPYFCREWCCFHYFCRTCYQTQHNSEEFRKHRPLMRNASKPQGTAGAVTAVSFSPFNNRNNINTSRPGGTTGNINNFNNSNNSWGSNSGYNQPRRQDYGTSRYSMLH